MLVQTNNVGVVSVAAKAAEEFQTVIDSGRVDYGPSLQLCESGFEFKHPNKEITLTQIPYIELFFLRVRYARLYFDPALAKVTCASSGYDYAALVPRPSEKYQHKAASCGQCLHSWEGFNKASKFDANTKQPAQMCTKRLEFKVLIPQINSTQASAESLKNVICGFYLPSSLIEVFRVKAVAAGRLTGDERLYSNCYILQHIYAGAGKLPKYTLNMECRPIEGTIVDKIEQNVLPMPSAQFGV